MPDTQDGTPESAIKWIDAIDDFQRWARDAVTAADPVKAGHWLREVAACAGAALEDLGQPLVTVRPSSSPTFAVPPADSMAPALTS